MTSKTDQARAALETKINTAQRLIMQLQEEYGNERAFVMINTMMTELEPGQAALLRKLVTAMQSEAMGDAGTSIH